jgi:hypothetical protein
MRCIGNDPIIEIIITLVKNEIMVLYLSSFNIVSLIIPALFLTTGMLSFLHDYRIGSSEIGCRAYGALGTDSPKGCWSGLDQDRGIDRKGPGKTCKPDDQNRKRYER